ncbi:hypothetical protein Vadar_012060 [Vaccinium darrowii]|uniref:Uncharacterized protein n=1 Tax=Vaccinium darrowii TaxID=229202 RepID=A0ACB7X048_9ERIC|nr:hypothetical protein Vadar_012060 [Vaccinium darrowii]
MSKTSDNAFISRELKRQGSEAMEERNAKKRKQATGLEPEESLPNTIHTRGKHWFCASTSHWGYPKFMALSDFKNTSKGFLMNDVVVIEVQIMQIFTSKDI